MRSQSTSCGNGAVVGLEPEPGPPRRDAQGLRGPGAGQRPVADGGGQVGPRHDQLAPGPLLARVVGDRAVRRGVTDQPRPRVAPGQRLTGHGRGPHRLAEHGPVGGDVGDLDPQHEPHRVQPGRQRAGRAGLGGDPGGLAVVHEVQVVLDVALGAQHEGLGGHQRREAGEHLGGDRVQPGQPVRSGDRDHAPVGQVDRGQALGQQPLLAQRVAVVGGDARVGAVGRDGAGRRQQRAGRGRRGRWARRGGHRVDCWEHAAHHPWIAMCLTSATKPSRARRFPTNASAWSIGLSVTLPQRRHTRCRWSACSARW